MFLQFLPLEIANQLSVFMNFSIIMILHIYSHIMFYFVSSFFHLAYNVYMVHPCVTSLIFYGWILFHYMDISYLCSHSFVNRDLGFSAFRDLWMMILWIFAYRYLSIYFQFFSCIYLGIEFYGLHGYYILTFGETVKLY